jgi:hypothetical protein
VFLVPRAIYKDPFRGGDNILVLADCYEPPHEDENGALHTPYVLKNYLKEMACTYVGHHLERLVVLFKMAGKIHHQAAIYDRNLSQSLYPSYLQTTDGLQD